MWVDLKDHKELRKRLKKRNKTLAAFFREQTKHFLQTDDRRLATRKTATMQKELVQAGDAGFSFVGVTVAETSFGGKEVVSILRRLRR